MSSDGERVEGSRARKSARGCPDQEEVHFSSVRQAEQRNKIQEKEEHGAKRGLRGLYKLRQRVLTERHLRSLQSTATGVHSILRMRVRVQLHTSLELVIIASSLRYPLSLCR